MRELPRPYLRFLTGVALFGAGDFAPTLLVMAAAQLLAPKYGMVRAGEIAALCSMWCATWSMRPSSYPAGALADRINKPALLAAGYALGGLTALWAAALFCVWRDRVFSQSAECSRWRESTPEFKTRSKARFRRAW